MKWFKSEYPMINELFKAMKTIVLIISCIILYSVISGQYFISETVFYGLITMMIVWIAIPYIFIFLKKTGIYDIEKNIGDDEVVNKIVKSSRFFIIGLITVIGYYLITRRAFDDMTVLYFPSATIILLLVLPLLVKWLRK